MNCLKEADKLVHGSRQKDYDHPKHNFKRIADLWNGYMSALGYYPIFTVKDIPRMMVLLKMAREIHKHKPDNLIDMAGYVATEEMLYDGEEE